MSKYEEGLELIEKSCGNMKDNAVALSTIALEPAKISAGFWIRKTPN